MSATFSGFGPAASRETLEAALALANQHALAALPADDPYRVLQIHADGNHLVKSLPQLTDARDLARAIAEQHGGGPSSLQFAVYRRGRELARYGAEGRVVHERGEIVEGGQGRTVGEVVDAASAAAVSIFLALASVLGGLLS